jgi:hypothetical protein
MGEIASCPSVLGARMRSGLAMTGATRRATARVAPTLALRLWCGECEGYYFRYQTVTETRHLDQVDTTADSVMEIT